MAQDPPIWPAEGNPGVIANMWGARSFPPASESKPVTSEIHDQWHSVVEGQTDEKAKERSEKLQNAVSNFKI